MAKIAALLLLLPALSACAAATQIGVAGIGAAGAVTSAAIKTTGAVVGAGVDAVKSDHSNKDK